MKKVMLVFGARPEATKMHRQVNEQKTVVREGHTHGYVYFAAAELHI